MYFQSCIEKIVEIIILFTFVFNNEDLCYHYDWLVFVILVRMNFFFKCFYGFNWLFLFYCKVGEDLTVILV